VKGTRPLRGVSLFAGIGGFELGAEVAGVPVDWLVAVEKDEAARLVLAERFPETRLFDDVTQLECADDGLVEVMVGGFPCQDISVAGKGKGLEGERSGLWYEYLRLVEEARPRLVLIENVYQGWKRWVPGVRSGLHGIGYASVPLRVSAADVGAPHRRLLCFVVAYLYGSDVRDGAERRSPGWPWELRAEGEEEPRQLGEARGTAAPGLGEPDEGDRAQDHAYADSDRCERERGGGQLDEGERAALRHDVDGFHPTHAPDAKGQGLEGRRQGLPAVGAWRWWEAPSAIRRVDDGFPFGVDGREGRRRDKQRLKQLGNAICPQVAAVAWRWAAVNILGLP
jgi:site-specific DNA-cytosine methylase